MSDPPRKDTVTGSRVVLRRGEKTNEQVMQELFIWMVEQAATTPFGEVGVSVVLWNGQIVKVGTERKVNEV